MEITTNQKRNTYVDFLRGTAMLIVVFGHTMNGSTVKASDSVLHNIVWSLQMPLFILISGYVTRYSRVPNTGRKLLGLLGRRTLMYLLPWFVFTIIINGLVLEKQTLTVDAVFMHMDKSYWFLITIWTISMIFLPARYFAVNVCKKSGLVPLTVFAFYSIGMALTGCLGMFAGLDFLCIKLTLYYMPFFFLGYLFGVYGEQFVSRYSRTVSVIVAISTILWIAAILKLRIYYLSDTEVLQIILRAGISLCGCIAVCGLMKFIKKASLIYRGVSWIGRHSIEVYLLHYYFLNLIILNSTPDFLSARGIALVAMNYVITIAIAVAVAKLLGSNRYLNLMLFGRITKN